MIDMLKIRNLQSCTLELSFVCLQMPDVRSDKLLHINAEYHFIFPYSNIA